MRPPSLALSFFLWRWRRYWSDDVDLRIAARRRRWCWRPTGGFLRLIIFFTHHNYIFTHRDYLFAHHDYFCYSLLYLFCVDPNLGCKTLRNSLLSGRPRREVRPSFFISRGCREVSLSGRPSLLSGRPSLLSGRPSLLSVRRGARSGLSGHLGCRNSIGGCRFVHYYDH